MSSSQDPSIIDSPLGVFNDLSRIVLNTENAGRFCTNPFICEHAVRPHHLEKFYLTPTKYKRQSVATFVR